jgi:hypothetical protein
MILDLSLTFLDSDFKSLCAFFIYFFNLPLDIEGFSEKSENILLTANSHFPFLRPTQFRQQQSSRQSHPIQQKQNNPCLFFSSRPRIKKPFDSQLFFSHFISPITALKRPKIIIY